jgi:hypothetical protein
MYSLQKLTVYTDNLCWLTRLDFPVPDVLSREPFSGCSIRLAVSGRPVLAVLAAWSRAVIAILAVAAKLCLLTVVLGVPSSPISAVLVILIELSCYD